MVTREDNLLQRAVAGDAEAAAELLRRHSPAVQQALRIDPKWQSVLSTDDIMQVTYLEVLQRIRKFDCAGGASFPTWMRRIAENNLRDAIKELSRRKRPQPQQRVKRLAGPGTEEDSCLTMLDHLVGTTTTPSRHAARNEIAAAVRAAIDKLPADYATVVRLYDLERRPIEEVTRTMGRSVGAVHMLRSRAHDRLRELLVTDSQFFSQGSSK